MAITESKSSREMSESHRLRIKTGMIINRMNKHVLSENGDVMTPSQVQAAKILLAKTLPDLKMVDAMVTGDVNARFTVIERVIVDPSVIGDAEADVGTENTDA